MDYRRKIENKGDKLKEAGSVYLQKCIDIDHFSILAFLKVDPDRQGESLQIGIKNLMNYCK